MSAMDRDEGMTTAVSPKGPATELSGAEIIARALGDHSVKHVFGCPDGTVFPIYDALLAADPSMHVHVRHAKSSVRAAKGYARWSGKPGVVVVMSAAGSATPFARQTNMAADDIPIVVLVGHSATHAAGSRAFEECDSVDGAGPCAKFNWLVRDANDLVRVIHQAFKMAVAPQPGTVFIDIPMEVQLERGRYQAPDISNRKDVSTKIWPAGMAGG
jgi:acetolactate synthase-1/2/3 large subunit